MKASYLLHGEMHVGSVADPIPGKGQAVVRTHSCGLCASDAHWLTHGEQMVAMAKEYGMPFGSVDLDRPIVPGHEFVGEIIDYGPGSRRPIKPGARVVSLLGVQHTDGQRHIVGHSNEFPGGFGEYMLLDENQMMEVPAGLDDDLAAMTEPLAVGLEHARTGDLRDDDVPLVVGCGVIGLAVIAGLKLMGAQRIIAADYDPGRRATAILMGASVAVDPREMSPYGPIPDLAMRRATLVYECVGRAGMLHEITTSVGEGTRIVVGGFCLETEHLFVPCAQLKRLKIYFARGEERQDFDLALRSIADGKVDVSSWLGPRICMSDVGTALEAMSDPSVPIRTVVDPRLG